MTTRSVRFGDTGHAKFLAPRETETTDYQQNKKDILMNATKVALKVTPDDLYANIATINFLNVGDAIVRTGQPDHERHHCLTLCILVLKNGFVLTGESSCVSRANYDQGIGEAIALANAKDKMWPLMGYALREQLAVGAGQ